ncbi:MAG: alpha/beta hydrolase family protein [Bifidobacteriaceae bacterium]|jgi:hypothetical protein|nr:alpha/beta hydrolase family protein [Bifidobacteriaceae bacterium]
MIEFRFFRQARRTVLIALLVMGSAGLDAPIARESHARAAAVERGPEQPAPASYRLAPDGRSASIHGDPDLRIEVFGALATADAIAVLVPGVGHDPADFDSRRDAAQDPSASPSTLPDRARALRQAASEADPDASLAVVAWLGYTPPSGVMDALGAAPIAAGAANLAAFQRFLNQANPEAPVTWVCHSYGSLVCASALESADPDALALIGSPGVQVDHASQLATAAPVFAARGEADPIALTRALDLLGGGFGADPANPGFGAKTIACDPRAGHSDYFRPGSRQLAGLADVALKARSA